MKTRQSVSAEHILDFLCGMQREVCNEFIENEGRYTFDNIVRLVNDVVNASDKKQKDMWTLYQAVYKIATLAQGMSPNASPRTTAICNHVWRGKIGLRPIAQMTQEEEIDATIAEDLAILRFAEAAD